jgi:hypothetical protein
MGVVVEMWRWFCHCRRSGNSTHQRLLYYWRSLIQCDLLRPGVSLGSNTGMSLRCGAGLVTICIFNGIVVADLDETTLFQQNQKKKRRLYSRLLPLQEISVICTHNNWPDNLTGHRYPIRLASLPISALENRTNRPSSQELPSKPWNPTSSQPPTPSQRSCSTWPCPHRGAGG